MAHGERTHLPRGVLCEHTFDCEPMKVFEACKPTKAFPTIAGFESSIQSVEGISVLFVKPDAVVPNNEAVNRGNLINHVGLVVPEDRDLDRSARWLDRPNGLNRIHDKLNDWSIYGRARANILYRSLDIDAAQLPPSAALWRATKSRPTEPVERMLSAIRKRECIDNAIGCNDPP